MDAEFHDKANFELDLGDSWGDGMEELDKGAIGLALGFLGKELFDWVKGKLNKESETRDAELKKNTEAINELKFTLTKLECTLKSFEEKLTAIPKLQSDVNEAHAKIRELKAANGKHHGS